MNEVQEKTKDDIINEEIEAEHALTDEEKTKLAKEAEKVELAEGETIDEGVSDEETLSKAIQASMSEKKQEFLAEMSKNPNKRLYSSRITLEFAELIEVDKTQLRYEENEDDYKFNNDLMKLKQQTSGLICYNWRQKFKIQRIVQLNKLNMLADHIKRNATAVLTSKLKQ